MDKLRTVPVESAKPRRARTPAAKRLPRGAFIGTRPLSVPMTLRGQVVDVEVRPMVGSTTHVNYRIIIRCGGKVMDWVPTREELERIGCTAGMHTELQTSH